MRRILQITASGAVFAALGCSGDGGGDDAAYSRDKLLDPETCNECHQDHFKEWSGSMHAYASTDPLFLAMNERGQKETNGALGDFCVKCHAPMAVQEKKTEDGTNLSTLPKELQGITCYFCHQVTDVTDTHDNPLVLANDTTMRGGIPNPLKYKGHGAEYSKLHDSDDLGSSKLCGACHDIVVPGHFSGAAKDVELERTFAEWRESVFNDPQFPTQQQSCGRCHFDREPNTPIASPENPTKTMPSRPARHMHAFPAIDTALVDGFPETDAQHRAIQTLLDTQTLRVGLCVDRGTSSVRVELDNLSAGHRFPSGASQDRRIWVELHAYDAADAEICSSGVVDDGMPVTSLVDPTRTAPDGTLDPWILRDVVAKADGSPAHMFWDVASVDPKTIRVATSEDPTHALAHDYGMTDCTGQAVLPARITAKVRVEPVGLDVFDDMNDSGHDVAAIRDRMPRFDVLPHRRSKEPRLANVTLEFVPKNSSMEQECVYTGTAPTPMPAK